VSDQIDRIYITITHIEEACAIVESIAAHFERDKPSEADLKKAFAITGHLIYLASDILERQISSLFETADALHTIYLEQEAVAA